MAGHRCWTRSSTPLLFPDRFVAGRKWFRERRVSVPIGSALPAALNRPGPPLAQRPQPREAGNRARGERLQEFKAAGIIGTLGTLQIGVDQGLGDCFRIGLLEARGKSPESFRSSRPVGRHPPRGLDFGGRIRIKGLRRFPAHQREIGYLAPSRARSEIRDWQSLVGDGSIRRLLVSVRDVNKAFADTGNAAAAAHPEEGDPDDPFIDLYVADVAVPTIGRSLLGDEGYKRLAGRLKGGQQALVVAGSGRYSFKGAAYVRGGIFDRIELVQETNSVRFRDRDHIRLGSLEAEDAPDFPEIALFTVPPELALEPAEPWLLRLLVQRVVGARDKALVTLDLGYTLPEIYLKSQPPPAQSAAAPPAKSSAPIEAERRQAGTPPAATDEEPLWMRIWRADVIKIGITVAALGMLTLIFFFQNVLVRRPEIYAWIRRGYLVFILVWLGWYANAQLSVVNVLTFANSLLTGFSWEYFLSAPLIFILWASIAAGLLFWGRGPFCGWLCPFGALQELLNNAAQALKVPQFRVPWGLHERLWPIKYIIFLGLFGMSLYSTAFAEHLAEVEPFKTSIVLKFAREWPFVLYALTLLAAGLFVERFFCRYVCPLGAALAIPGRIRMFEWLRRWPECGTPCQRCAKECPVQAIHPEGHINVNECIYCMHCQELYFDDHRCPHMIQVRLKREKREALSSPSMRSGGKGPNTVITAAGKPVALSPVGATTPPAT